MVIEVKPKQEDVDAKALRVFLKSLEILGGPRKIIEYRNLTWLPSLMTASYAIILHKEKNYSAERIGEFLGISTTTAKNILSADEELIKEKISNLAEERDESKRTHTAGALAKVAYKEIMQGKDEISLMVHLAKETSKSLGVEWAVKVLSMLKGIDFPLSKDRFLERLRGVDIKGKPIEELADKMDFPIDTPAELLHKMKEAMND